VLDWSIEKLAFKPWLCTAASLMAKEMNRIAQLQQMLKLEERRQKLQSELDELDSEFASIGEGILVERPPSRVAALKEMTPPSKMPVKVSSEREARGGLKERVMSMLESAGAGGISVRELAEALRTKLQNIHSWFNNTGRKNPAIKKVGEARYSLDSAKGVSMNAESNVEAAPKPAPARKTSAPKKSATSKGGGSARGELRDKILAELKASGTKGVTVKELSEKVGVPYKNVSIWFSTTGRKHSEIKKIAPARYSIA
jgi:lambda repressor-like predicted transcriptional regulator